MALYHLIFQYGLLCLTVAVAQDATAAGSSKFAFLEDGYCSSTPSEAFDGSIDLGSMDCAKIMEFVYVSRWKLWQHLDGELAEVNKTSGPTAGGALQTLRFSSRASSLVSAHVHIITAVASQRAECFSEHVRLLLTVSLRRMKTLSTEQVKQLWHASQDGFANEADHASRLKAWLSEATGLLDADLRTLKTVLQTWTGQRVFFSYGVGRHLFLTDDDMLTRTPPTLAESRFYSHEADGRYSTMEALRRDTFEEYQLDKGLLQGMLRMFSLDSVVADFGAGSGQYAKWLNDTGPVIDGLVTAMAFDGSPDIHLVTKGQVALADLGQPLNLWRRFDWSFCLEVAEHLPSTLTPTFLANLDKHTENGLIITWARPGLQGLGTANPLTQDQALELIRQHTGLTHFDQELTAALRASASIPHIADTLLVMVRPSAATEPLPTSDAAPACNAEHGWIYAGNDVQMFNAAMKTVAFGRGPEKRATRSFVGSRRPVSTVSVMRGSSRALGTAADPGRAAVGKKVQEHKERARLRKVAKGGDPARQSVASLAHALSPVLEEHESRQGDGVIWSQLEESFERALSMDPDAFEEADLEVLKERPWQQMWNMYLQELEEGTNLHQEIGEIPNMDTLVESMRKEGNDEAVKASVPQLQRCQALQKLLSLQEDLASLTRKVALSLASESQWPQLALVLQKAGCQEVDVSNLLPMALAGFHLQGVFFRLVVDEEDWRTICAEVRATRQSKGPLLLALEGMGLRLLASPLLHEPLTKSEKDDIIKRTSRILLDYSQHLRYGPQEETELYKAAVLLQNPRRLLSMEVPLAQAIRAAPRSRATNKAPADCLALVFGAPPGDLTSLRCGRPEVLVSNSMSGLLEEVATCLRCLTWRLKRFSDGLFGCPCEARKEI
eukprot:symbB.v1.2.027728.t1/scaffold2866.1/size70932/4